jgi:hypothetical protein
MWAVQDERFDYSYRQVNEYFPPITPRDMKRRRWLLYLHAGRYIEGARDGNAKLAWGLYLERVDIGKRNFS